MKKFYILFLLTTSLLVGCSTVVPVMAKFPPIPERLLENCPQLKPVDSDTVTMSQFTKTVVVNYTTYYECAVKNDAWIEWYQVQKKIYESK
jgi:hypothetical protein